MKKHNSSENVRKTNKENEIIVDLWDLNSYGVTNRNINKSNKHTSTPSITSASSNTKHYHHSIKRTKSVDKSNQNKYHSNNNNNNNNCNSNSNSAIKKQRPCTSLPKHISSKKQSNMKSNFNISLSDFNNPDNVVKYIKHKCIDNTNTNNNNKPRIKDYDNFPLTNNNNDNTTNRLKQKHIRKSSQEIQTISNNLYNKKTVSSNYQLQQKMKKISDNKKQEEELSECTFKPKLYSNNQKRKSNNNEQQLNSNQIYEQQNKWLNIINEKKEKKYEMKQLKELEHCSFNPKTTKMPNFNKGNYVNKTNVEKELYYSKLKRVSQDKMKLNEKEKDFAKCYDQRKKKENLIKQNNLQKDNCVYSAPQYYKELQPNTDANSNNISSNCSRKEVGFKSSQMSNVNLDSVINSNSNNNNKITSPYNIIGNCHVINSNNNQIDYDFEMKKEMLMKDLHDWKNDNEEDEEDDFFS